MIPASHWLAKDKSFFLRILCLEFFAQNFLLRIFCSEFLLSIEDEPNRSFFKRELTRNVKGIIFYSLLNHTNPVGNKVY